MEAEERAGRSGWVTTGNHVTFKAGSAWERVLSRQACDSEREHTTQQILIDRVYGGRCLKILHLPNFKV